jgi:hypothetical protein
MAQFTDQKKGDNNSLSLLRKPPMTSDGFLESSVHAAFHMVAGTGYARLPNNGKEVGEGFLEV